MESQPQLLLRTVQVQLQLMEEVRRDRDDRLNIAARQLLLRTLLQLQLQVVQLPRLVEVVIMFWLQEVELEHR